MRDENEKIALGVCYYLGNNIDRFGVYDWRFIFLLGTIIFPLLPIIYIIMGTWIYFK